MSRFTLAALALATIAGCAIAPAAADDAPSPKPATAPRAGCKLIDAVAYPIAAPQYHDAALQQTAGRLTLRIDHGELQTGTVVATIVGKAPDGSLRGNHDGLFPRLGFRTRDDKVIARPTSAPCVFDATTELHVVETTGALGHLTGTLRGTGSVNLCGGEGRVEISGQLCAP